MTDYDTVKLLDPDGYRKAVEIGSLVTCGVNDTFDRMSLVDRMLLAAKVEQAVIALLADRVRQEKA